MSDFRYIFAALAALAILGLALWAVTRPPSAASVAPTSRPTASAPAAAEPGSPTEQPVRRIPGTGIPGGPLFRIAAVGGPVARCPAWPQLVLVHDTAGFAWWVTQQDAGPPDPSQLGPDGLLPVDPRHACQEIVTS
jgi:hypothetical protein